MLYIHFWVKTKIILDRNGTFIFHLDISKAELNELKFNWVQLFELQLFIINYIRTEAIAIQTVNVPPMFNILPDCQRE
jgi:hypothetical protein